MIKKKYFIAAYLIAFSFILQAFGMTQTAQAAPVTGWNAGNIISDSIFTNNHSMSYDDIKAFLNSKVPNCDTWGTQPSEFGGGTRAQYGAAHGNPAPFICLKDYVENGRGAPQIIYDTAQQFQINPQVLIVLLQKEQGLVTDTWPFSSTYRKATGYACGDSAPTCDSQYYGFTNQVYQAARMYRAIMNNSPTWYTPYVLGNNYIQYNPTSSCGGSVVNIENRATQALYNYTPYQPNQGALDAGYGQAPCGAYGNRNFYLYFQNWFGSTHDGRCVNGSGGNVSDVLFRRVNGVDLADFAIYSGSSTGCVETHLWNPGFTSWKLHSATAQPSIDFPYTQLVYGDLDANGNDYPVFFSLDKSGSNTVEAHILDRGLKNFLVHTGSNQPTVDVSHENVKMGDLDGDGHEAPILINYDTGASGKIEFWEWGDAMKSWKYHTITNMPAILPSNAVIEFADIDGDGRDEAILIAMQNTGSGMVEFHVWNPGQQSWRAHIVSNMPAVSPATGKILFADIDGNGVDEPVLIGMKNTGSGKIEFHVWNPGFNSWRMHVASNQPAQQ